MSVPQVAIVGRPNVGKSSLFNWLTGQRIAIVAPTSGVTRDRLTALVQLRERFFELVDTGGIGIEDPDQLSEAIERQIQEAIEQAAVILFVVDVQAGITPLDQQVAERLRYVSKPTICVANKCDSPQWDMEAAQFYRLGRGKLICTSTIHDRNRERLLERIVERLPPDEDALPGPDPVMKVAIVGRRNVGKSTFINTLTAAERVIVSEIPGTTRDSIDVRFELDGQNFLAIDTPGVRRRKSIADDVEFYSLTRAQRSVRRADVVLLFFDPTERISKVDKQLATYIADHYKPCIFVVNKWDLLVPTPTEKWVGYIRDTFRTMSYVPMAFITAKTGKNVKALLNLAQNLFKQSRRRVGTGQLNRIFQAAIAHNPPPHRQNRMPKLYFTTQVGTQPPTIVAFVNNPGLFDATYFRYLLGVLRDHSPFPEVPIKLYLRRRESAEGPAGPPAPAPKEQAADRA